MWFKGLERLRGGWAVQCLGGERGARRALVFVVALKRVLTYSIVVLCCVLRAEEGACRGCVWGVSQQGEASGGRKACGQGTRHGWLQAVCVVVVVRRGGVGFGGWVQDEDWVGAGLEEGAFMDVAAAARWSGERRA